MPRTVAAVFKAQIVKRTTNKTPLKFSKKTTSATHITKEDARNTEVNEPVQKRRHGG